MGKYPITQAQWKAVVDLPKVEEDLTDDPCKFKGANRPVEGVIWYEAVEFCARLSQKTGKSYRLPTEAEWEYACRAGTTTPFHFGETITPDLANYDGNSHYASGLKGKYRKETTEVGIFPPNAFGIYDMHGNVLEWCADSWHANYVDAPIDGSVWDTQSHIERLLQVVWSSLQQTRVLRGGAWGCKAELCRSACRINYSPSVQNHYSGFRVVCTGV